MTQCTPMTPWKLWTKGAILQPLLKMKTPLMILTPRLTSHRWDSDFQSKQSLVLGRILWTKTSWFVKLWSLNDLFCDWFAYWMCFIGVEVVAIFWLFLSEFSRNTHWDTAIVMWYYFSQGWDYSIVKFQWRFTRKEFVTACGSVHFKTFSSAFIKLATPAFYDPRCFFCLAIDNSH